VKTAVQLGSTRARIAEVKRTLPSKPELKNHLKKTSSLKIEFGREFGVRSSGPAMRFAVRFQSFRIKGS